MLQVNQYLVCALSLFGSGLASAVLDLIPSNFDDVVLKSGKPALVEFFAPWCGHCKRLAPVWEELATSFEFAKDRVSIAKVDADAEKSLGKRFGVQGFPTLKWFDGQSDKAEDYNGGRDLEELQEFITSKTGIKLRKKAQAPSSVQMLTDQSFKSEIGKEKDVLVAITAPWCGHCKSLAPIWEQVATTFASEKSVLIAKIDAEAEQSKATAKDLGVTSYPTIKFFPRGSSAPKAYEGGRSEDDFVNYINEQSGTYRLAGGSLNAKAGTIEALDNILLAATGDDAATLAQKISDAAKSLKDTYAEYYIRASKKISNDEGYLEKELARLEGLVKKGGLAPQKLDELTSRSNILRKFKKEAAVKGEL